MSEIKIHENDINVKEQKIIQWNTFHCGFSDEYTQRRIEAMICSKITITVEQNDTLNFHAIIDTLNYQISGLCSEYWNVTNNNSSIFDIGMINDWDIGDICYSISTYDMSKVYKRYSLIVYNKAIIQYEDKNCINKMKLTDGDKYIG